MPADLTLPGSIPGLLRRGSPVFWRDEETPYVVAWIGPWPDSDTVEPGAIVLAAPGSSPCIGVEDNATNFALDLTDATGRAHAAWWLAGAPPFVSHVAGMGRSTPWASMLDSWLRPTSEGGGDRRPCDRNAWVAVSKVLADLDPHDPRLLPDGSRWVHAEALRLVALHVAGVPDGQ